MGHQREPGSPPGLISEDAVLQEVARDLTGAHDPLSVLRRLAEAARAASAAEAGYLERFHSALGYVEIAAAAGAGAPEVGGRVPLRGSDPGAARDADRPVALEPEELDARPTSHLLGPDGRRCRALVLPLAGGDEPLGALVLLRSPEAPPFGEGEAARLRAFADVAALALRLLVSQEESERRRADLERVVASRAGLIRDVSHDLKNPLGAADGYLELLEDGLMGELGEKQREGIRRARRSIRSALSLIHDLAELTQAETGRIELSLGPLEVQEALEELVGSFRGRAESRRVELRTACPADLPVLVTDGQRVRQVLSNLLSNAIKYTPEGGTVSVEAFASPGSDGGASRWMSIAVRDTGPGIPPERQEEIFREFSRLTAGESPGAGLGLAVSRRIAQALGGDIRLESEPGRGACFTLSIPPVDPDS
jgi:signal transduction histidine kinase